MANELALYNPSDGSVVVYQSEDGTLQLDVQLSDDTVWLSQQQMAILFNVKENNITDTKLLFHGSRNENWW